MPRLCRATEVEKVPEPGNVVPKNFLGMNFQRKFSRKILTIKENLSNMKLYCELWR